VEERRKKKRKKPERNGRKVRVMVVVLVRYSDVV
jgi:hypothetical protein